MQLILQLLHINLPADELPDAIHEDSKTQVKQVFDQIKASSASTGFGGPTEERKKITNKIDILVSVISIDAVYKKNILSDEKEDFLGD